jgi:hypothetical protein
MKIQSQTMSLSNGIESIVLSSSAVAARPLLLHSRNNLAPSRACPDEISGQRKLKGKPDWRAGKFALYRTSFQMGAGTTT